MPGYAMASWERGYGDFHLRPDLGDAAPRSRGSRRRRSCSATSRWDDGSPVVASPRQVLEGARSSGRAPLGFEPMFGSELEFYPPPRDLRRGAREALPRPHAVGAVHPRLPHPRDELRRAVHPRRSGTAMQGAGMPVETSKGEAWPGQHEINFRFADALRDGGRPRRLQERRQGDRVPARLLDHVHGEAATTTGSAPRATSTPRSGGTARTRSRTSRDDLRALPRRLDRLRSPSSRSSSRRRSTRTSASRRAQWAPTTLAWGHDNRTCGFRVVGHGAARARLETRIPGARRRTRTSPSRRCSPPACTGSRRSSSSRRRSRATRTSPTPSASRTRCARRSRALERRDGRAAALGDEVVDHYLNYARTEQRAVRQDRDLLGARAHVRTWLSASVSSG